MSVPDGTSLKPYRVGLTLEVLATSERDAHSLVAQAGASLQGAPGICHPRIDHAAQELER